MLLGKIFIRTTGKRYVLSSQDVMEVLEYYYPQATISLADHQYCYVELNEWKRMFLRVVTMLQPYMPDFRDCDDFADFLKGIIAILFAVNTCFRATGLNSNGKAHAYSLILYRDGNAVKVALVESQSLTIGCEGYTVSAIRG
jgi:hypothetical protein